LAEPLLSVRELSVTLPGGRPLVGPLSFNLPPGGTLALVGESGSGKSLTSLAVIGLLPPPLSVGPTSRLIWHDGRDLSALAPGDRRRMRGAEIAMIFQEPMTALNPMFPVGDQIAEALAAHTDLSRRARFAEVQSLLDLVGIDRPAERAASYPHELSGGMRQRAMIAMAVACRPKLLLADEPTTALDVTIQRQVLDLLADLQDRLGMAMIFVTHDLGVVCRIADEVVVLEKGREVERGPVADLLRAPRQDYTRDLIAAVPPLHGPRLARLGREARPAPSAPSQPRDATLLVVEGLGKTYRTVAGAEVEALRDVSFDLFRGETLGIVGESGSGKSTIARVLTGLTPPSAGRLAFDGSPIDWRGATGRRLRRRIQMVFQDPWSSLDPRMNVEAILTEGMVVHGLGRDTQDRRRRALRLLDLVALPSETLHRHPHEFSGGQRQRIAIARALSVEPELLIADEALSALDVTVQAQVANLLIDLKGAVDLSMIFIGHDLAVVRHLCDRVAVMHRGRVVEAGETEKVLLRPEADYTETLVAAVLSPLAPDTHRGSAFIGRR